jgi:hypothetical protein
MHAADIKMRMGYPVAKTNAKTKTKKNSRTKTPGMRGTFEVHVLHLKTKQIEPKTPNT